MKALFKVAFRSFCIFHSFIHLLYPFVDPHNHLVFSTFEFKVKMKWSSAETSAEPSLQAKQLQLKRARLADDLNDKISHRPGPIELVHKNILSVDCPVHSPLGIYPSFRPSVRLSVEV